MDKNVIQICHIINKEASGVAVWVVKPFGLKTLLSRDSASMLDCLLLCSLIIELSISVSHYSTNFSNYDSEHWVLDTGCNSCSRQDGGECTEDSINAFSWGSVFPSNNTGVTITTQRLSTPTQCGGLTTSGHMHFIPSLLYGNITVIARWFPGNANTVNTSTGFIGWDNNEACALFGLHGAGYHYNPDNNTYDFTHEIQTQVYANSTEYGKQKEYISTGNIDLATQFNTFNIIWTTESVEWIINGKIFRKESDPKYVPYIPMYLKLHTRSHEAYAMPPNGSFHAEIAYFEYNSLS